MNSKRRIIKDFDKLDAAVREAVELAYPNGYNDHLISFTTPKGEKIMALPFETEETIYLIRLEVIDLTKLKIDDDIDERPINEVNDDESSSDEDEDDDKPKKVNSDDDDYDESSSYRSSRRKNDDEDEYY